MAALRTLVARRGTIARAVAAAALVVLALICATAWSGAYRGHEASAAAAVARHVDPASAASGDAFHIDGSGDSGRWFVVTPACTTVLLLVPLVLFAAWSLVQRRLRPAMVVVGLAAGATVLVAFGTLRLSTIALAWRVWGDSSLWVTHTLAGSLISLASAVVALGLQAVVTGRGSPTLQRTFDRG